MDSRIAHRATSARAGSEVNDLTRLDGHRTWRFLPVVFPAERRQPTPSGRVLPKCDVHYYSACVIVAVAHGDKKRWSRGSCAGIFRSTRGIWLRGLAWYTDGRSLQKPKYEPYSARLRGDNTWNRRTQSHGNSPREPLAVPLFVYRSQPLVGCGTFISSVAGSEKATPCVRKWLCLRQRRERRVL